MRSFVFAGAALLAMPMAASADVVTYSASTSGLTDFYSTANLQQFNPALGTLDKVEFSATASIDGEFNFQNISGGSKRVRIDYIDWQVDVTGYGGPTGNVIHIDWVTAPTDDNPFGGPPGHFNLPLTAPIPVGSSFSTTYGDTYSSNATFLPADGAFASFVGTGTTPIDIALPVLFQVTIFGSGANQWSLHTVAGLDVSVTYTYTVPAPASAGLLGLGALIGCRRRRA